MKTKKTLIPFLAAAMLAAPSANAAFTIIATDTVEDHNAYTRSNWSGSIGISSGERGLLPVAGTNYVVASENSTLARANTARLTAGFGATTLVEAGTFRLTAYFGEGDINRDTWHAVDLSLMTTAGVAWESLVSNPITKTVTTAYVNPNGVGDIAEWVQVTVEYDISEGHALIDDEFTWGFTATKPSNGIAFYATYDAASVEFEAIPEPTTALLGGLGMLMLLRRRRS